MNGFLKKQRLEAGIRLAEKITRQKGIASYDDYLQWKELIPGINAFVVPSESTRPKTAQALLDVVSKMNDVLHDIRTARLRKNAVQASKLSSVQRAISTALSVKDARAIRALDAAANRRHRQAMANDADARGILHNVF